MCGLEEAEGRNMIGWVLRWGVVREASDWDAVEEVKGWRRMFVFGISERIL